MEWEHDVADWTTRFGALLTDYTNSKPFSDVLRVMLLRRLKNQGKMRNENKFVVPLQP
jgi:hypothetical protein